MNHVDEPQPIQPPEPPPPDHIGWRPNGAPLDAANHVGDGRRKAAPKKAAKKKAAKKKAPAKKK